MKFIFATINVKDLEESIRFYENVMGMKVKNRFLSGPNIEIAFLEDGAAEVELICNKEVKLPVHGESLSLGFAVEDLDRAMTDMKAQGIKIVAGPFQPNPKTRFFFIKDPDGVRLEIIEQK